MDHWCCKWKVNRLFANNLHKTADIAQQEQHFALNLLSQTLPRPQRNLSNHHIALHRSNVCCSIVSTERKHSGQIPAFKVIGWFILFEVFVRCSVIQ